MAGEPPELFDSVAQIESLAERAIREGQRRGQFDNLAGHGRPLPDLDTERPAGWWASRWIETEQRRQTAEEVREHRRAVRNQALHHDDVAVLRAQLDELNAQIRAHNRSSVDAEHHVELVDVHEAIGLWIRLRRTKREQRSRWGLL
ncbi:MAG: DUF1992 domain-containing protein [Acidimicrobiales bacterium]